MKKSKSLSIADPEPIEPDDDQSAEVAHSILEYKAENERLTELNTALIATDSGREIAKIVEVNGQLRGRIIGLLTENSDAKRKAKYYQSIAVELRGILSLDKTSEIVAAVKALKTK